MLETVISDLIRKQRPYYLPQGNPIKGVDNQHWLIFQHRDADNLLKNIVSFLGFQTHSTSKLIRIDLNTAHIFEYIPKQEGNLPNATLLRTSKLTVIEQFVQLENAVKEEALLTGSFLELETKIRRRRRFNLPDDINKYHQFITAYLERTKFYRRSTAYFESGVLKLYSEPLQNIVKNEGEIRLLMDWQGFTNNRDLKELQKLHDSEYRTQYIRRTLREFLAGLEDSSFYSTEILAELVRLGTLKIKLVKMEERRAIYHKKTGILSDRLDNHILHEGSDNFTRAAHSRNAESVTFLYYSDPIDLDAIKESIIEFDEEWQDKELTFDLSQEFLAQIIAERDRRQKLKQPVIESITPDEFPNGEITPVEITGSNLDRVETIEVVDDELVKVTIDSREPERIIGQVEVYPDHPSTSLKSFKVKTTTGTYNISPEKPVSVSSDLFIPEFPEIEGFKQAVELILAGKHGQPQDFLYWLAMERPHLLRVQQSDTLDEFVYQGILFEHQKSGAQHCLRVMQDFGVAVCADAVGLGKTRLAAAVAKLYRHEKGQAKVAIVAAKKLHDNWEREMTELGFRGNHLDYELYNKNLMSLKGNRFLDDFNRFGGADLIVIDEAHEGIRNYRNRIHQICLQIQQSDRASERERHFLLLTATPWNNRREDIYNILSPFLSRPEGFQDLDFPPEVALWFERRDAGVENFTDNTNLFRRTYRELFLQRTRQMLREATPDLNLYAKRVAQWLPVVFESDTEQALDQIFTQFETNLYIPSADPIRYLKGSTEQRSLLANQRRFFLQRAESSMYALGRTIKNFSDRIALVKYRLEMVSPDAEGLKEFLLLHYEFGSKKKDKSLDVLDLSDDWDEDYLEDEEDEDEDEAKEKKEEKRQQLRKSIDLATDALRDDSIRAKEIYYNSDLDQVVTVSPNNAVKGTNQRPGLKRQQIFRLFAPAATCRNPAERPQPEEEISVLIGSETLSVGQNLQDADYLINIDLPWNPMILEQRIGRIDRPKQHRVENIYIYYANSESQLLRQASRLSNLNKKLVGDLVEESGAIRNIERIDTLGASIYGDTLFDDEILPGYIDFIHSLTKARSLEQGSLQEDTYQKQETSHDLYTQNEILHSEELRKLIEELGFDYQANPIAVGHRTNNSDEPTCLVALTLEYYGPNGEPIPDQKQTIYWNDLTQENDGYGMAVSSAFKTPAVGKVVSAKNILTITYSLYEQLVKLKQQRYSELEQPETLENINLTSERISKIQKRIMAMDSFPSGINRKTVKDTLKKLNSGKEQKKVQKLLRDCTDGDKSQLNDGEFIEQLVSDTEILNLLNLEGIKPTSLKASLSALLLRTEA